MCLYVRTACVSMLECVVCLYSCACCICLCGMFSMCMVCAWCVHLCIKYSTQIWCAHAQLLLLLISYFRLCGSHLMGLHYTSLVDTDKERATIHNHPVLVSFVCDMFVGFCLFIALALCSALYFTLTCYYYNSHSGRLLGIYNR